MHSAGMWPSSLISDQDSLACIYTQNTHHNNASLVAIIKSTISGINNLKRLKGNPANLAIIDIFYSSFLPSPASNQNSLGCMYAEA